MNRYIILVITIFSLFVLSSCTHKNIKEKEKISVGYVVIGDYVFEKRENEFERPIRKNFMRIIPKVVRPISFKFINSQEIKKLLAEKNINLSILTLNENDLVKLGNILKDTDLMIIIKPIYIKVENKFLDNDNLKCSIKSGYGLMQLLVFDNTREKILLKKKFEANVQRKKCDKDIFPNLEYLRNKQIREEIIDKIFKQVTDKLVNEI